MYEAPTPDPYYRTYEIRANYVPISPSGDVVVKLEFGDFPEAVTDEVMQKMLDLIASSPDFAIAVAQKYIPARQVITPTA